MNPNRFKARFKMSPTEFDEIWNMIKDHNIFTNVSSSVQFDRRLQFLVVLLRLRAYENNTLRANIVASFYIHTGILLKFIKRVMVALLSLGKSVICWPNAAEIKNHQTFYSRIS